jgi:hypothetical protein
VSKLIHEILSIFLILLHEIFHAKLVVELLRVTGDNQLFIPHSSTSPALFAAFKKGYIDAGSVMSIFVVECTLECTVSKLIHEILSIFLILLHEIFHGYTRPRKWTDG